MKEAKFTACMVFNNDKALVQQLRDEFNINEKEMLTLLLQTALDNREALEARINSFKLGAAQERADARSAKMADHDAFVAARKQQRAADKELKVVPAVVDSIVMETEPKAAKKTVKGAKKR